MCQLITHICHLAMHKHTQRQVFSLSALRDGLPPVEPAYFHGDAEQHVVYEGKKRADVHAHWCPCTLCLFEVVFYSHSDANANTYMCTCNNMHTNMPLIASNSQHVHAFLVSCCLCVESCLVIMTHGGVTLRWTMSQEERAETCLHCIMGVYCACACLWQEGGIRQR